MDTQKMVEELKIKDKWIRGLFMVFFAVVLGLLKPLVLLIALFQFVHVLLTGARNLPLSAFSEQLVSYVAHVVSFLTYVTEDKPFPFADWPK